MYLLFPFPALSFKRQQSSLAFHQGLHKANKRSARSVNKEDLATVTSK